MKKLDYSKIFQVLMLTDDILLLEVVKEMLNTTKQKAVKNK